MGWGKAPTTWKIHPSIRKIYPSIWKILPSLRKKKKSMESPTQKNISKLARRQKTKQTSVKTWAKVHRLEKEASPEGRKRKADLERDVEEGKADQRRGGTAEQSEQEHL